METRNQRDKKGRFEKGMIPHNKDKAMPKIREENHYKWKGGTHATARTMAYRYGFNLNKCVGCNKNTKKTVVHHIDENPYNNKLSNLRILCYKCHAELHGLGLKTRFKKGHKVSKEVRDKISKANKGQKPWNKGLKKGGNN